MHTRRRRRHLPHRKQDNIQFPLSTTMGMEEQIVIESGKKPKRHSIKWKATTDPHSRPNRPNHLSNLNIEEQTNNKRRRIKMKNVNDRELQQFFNTVAKYPVIPDNIPLEERIQRDVYNINPIKPTNLYGGRKKHRKTRKINRKRI